MNSKPILFSGEMVKAILAGRKTQTRRVLTYQPDEQEAVYGPELYSPTVIGCGGFEEPGEEIYGVYGDDWGLKCPYGQPGDRLWVRETWDFRPWWSDGDGKMRKVRVSYAADGYQQTLECPPDWNPTIYSEQRWRPSIHMPRWASRIMLEVVNVRVERVQEITRDDAKAEGMSNVWKWDGGKSMPVRYHRRGVLNPYVSNFSVLWDSINEARGFGWDVNPWVWVVEFKVVEVKHV